MYANHNAPFLFFSFPALIPPFPPILLSPFPFCNCFSILGFCDSAAVLFLQFFLCSYSPEMSEIIWYLSFSPWLISLSILPSSSIHVVANCRTSFLSMAKLDPIVHMYHIFFIHSCTDGHLGSFHFLAIVNNAVRNIGVHFSFSGFCLFFLRVLWFHDLHSGLLSILYVLLCMC